jgi:hypothetical protein
MQPSLERRSIHSRRALLALGLIMIACLVAATAITPARAAPLAPMTAQVRCEPPAPVARVEDLLQVDLFVADVTDLYGLDVRLAFDPARAMVVDADPFRPGTQIEPLYEFLEPGFIVRQEADNAAGTIWYAATQLNPTPPVSGSGAVARVTFRALRPGAFALPVTQVQLANRDGIAIPATGEGCTITFQGDYMYFLPLVHNEW